MNKPWLHFLLGLIDGVLAMILVCDQHANNQLRIQRRVWEVKEANHRKEFEAMERQLQDCQQ